MTQPIDLQLKDYDTQFSLITEEVRALVSPLSDSQVSWRPAPDRWSIGDGITHLTLVGQLYLPTLDEGIRKARETGVTGQGPFRYRWLDRLMVRTTEPPPKRRFKAPHVFRPQESRYLTSEVLARFAAIQSSLSERLEAASGLDLRRSRIPSPAASFITLSLGAAFALLAAHERRHVWQARRVNEATGFPHA